MFSTDMISCQVSPDLRAAQHGMHLTGGIRRPASRQAVFYASTFFRLGGEATVRSSAMLHERKPLGRRQRRH